MKVHKNIWLRALIGLLALTVAGMLSLYIKEAMDEKDPEASLPLITVTYDGAELPGVYRAGWSWSFFLTIDKNTPALAPEDIPLAPVDMYAATPLNISFSTKPKDLKVSVAEGRYGTLYRPVEEAANGSFFAPSEAGEYVYKVEANWGRRGSIIYYFCVRVL